MLSRQNCVGCGNSTPDPTGEVTLTTSYGWRIRRHRLASGDYVTEWRCPACWQKFKAAQAASEPPKR